MATSAERAKTDRETWKAAFLKAFRDTGIVRAACVAAGIDRSTAYDERRRSKTFAKAWDEAKEDAADTLEAVARQRATAKIEPSDTLLIFLLKGMRPEVYRERYEVNINVVREAAAQLAAQTGLSVEEILAEAEALVRSVKGA